MFIDVLNVFHISLMESVDLLLCCSVSLFFFSEHLRLFMCILTVSLYSFMLEGDDVLILRLLIFFGQ